MSMENRKIGAGAAWDGYRGNLGPYEIEQRFVSLCGRWDGSNLGRWRKLRRGCGRWDGDDGGGCVERIK